MTNEIAPIVTVKNNVVVSNSRNVAAYFGKRHNNVVAKIDGLLADLPTPHAYFQAGVYTLPETGSQTHTCFDMTRDGFALLAMGFTGKKALKFKLDYIAQYNTMEEIALPTAGVGAISEPDEVRPFWRVHVLPGVSPCPSPQRRLEATPYQPAGELPLTLA